MSSLFPITEQSGRGLYLLSANNMTYTELRRTNLTDAHNQHWTVKAKYKTTYDDQTGCE